MTDKDSKEVQDWYQKAWSSVPSTSSKPESKTESCGTQAPVLLNEPSITPVPFHGKSSENAKDWLSYFQRYVTFKQLQDRSALGLFALLMRDAANTWFLSLSDDVRSDLKETLKSFWDKFEPTPVSRWRRASDMWNRDQRQDESVDAYHYDMLRRATEVNAPDEMTRYAIMKGLRPAYRAYVMQQNPKTTEELLEAALATFTDSSSATSSAILDAINRLEQRVTAPFEETRRPALRNSTSPSRFPRSPSPAFPSRDRRQVRFNDQRSQPFNDTRQPFRNVEQRQWNEQPPPPQWRAQPRTPTGPPFARPQAGCRNCGRIHAANACFAYGKTCRNCGKSNHFAVVCRSAPRSE